MHYKQNKAQQYTNMYKNLKPQTKKFILLGIALSLVLVSVVTVSLGYVVYKASALVINTVKIENPNFKVDDVNSLINAVMSLQEGAKTTLLSEACQTSLQTHFNVATFLLNSVDTIITNVKKDCLQKEDQPNSDPS